MMLTLRRSGCSPGIRIPGRASAPWPQSCAPRGVCRKCGSRARPDRRRGRALAGSGARHKETQVGESRRRRDQGGATVGRHAGTARIWPVDGLRRGERMPSPRKGSTRRRMSYSPKGRADGLGGGSPSSVPLDRILIDASADGDCTPGRHGTWREIVLNGPISVSSLSIGRGRNFP